MSLRKYPTKMPRICEQQEVFLNEKMETARELSSCCIGTEAALETNSGFKGLTRRLANKPDSKQ